MQSAKQNIPLAEEKIVHDRFHVMKLANEAVDKIRRGEHRQLQLDDDQRLKGTKYLWITGQENLSDQQRDLFDLVYSRGLETGKAWWNAPFFCTRGYESRGWEIGKGFVCGGLPGWSAGVLAGAEARQPAANAAGVW